MIGLIQSRQIGLAMQDDVPQDLPCCPGGLPFGRLKIQRLVKRGRTQAHIAQLPFPPHPYLVYDKGIINNLCVENDFPAVTQDPRIVVLAVGKRNAKPEPQV